MSLSCKGCRAYVLFKSFPCRGRSGPNLLQNAFAIGSTVFVQLTHTNLVTYDICINMHVTRPNNNNNNKEHICASSVYEVVRNATL